MQDILTDRVCDERNTILYELFGWFANRTEKYTDVKPINELKGLPEDVSANIASNDYFRFGGFTSYLTLEEILNYNWDATISHIGRIPEKSYVNWKRMALLQLVGIDILLEKIKSNYPIYHEWYFRWKYPKR